jgi:hypothetical protein
MKFKPGDMLPPMVMEAVTGEAIKLLDACWRVVTCNWDASVGVVI